MRPIFQGITTLIFALQLSLASGQNSTDSLKTLLPQVSDSQRVVLLCDIGFNYRLRNSDSALHYTSRGLELAAQLNSPPLISQALNDQGIILADLNRYPEALENYQRALEIRQQLNDSVRIGALHSKIGITHQKQGAYDQAMEHQLAALRIFEALGIENYVAICQNNVAILNFNLGDYDRSLEMHFNALGTRRSLNDEFGVASSYSNIANVYLALEDTTAAADYYEEATASFERLNDPEGLSTSLHNWAACFQQSNPAKALELLERALAIRAKMGDEKMLASTHTSIGAALLEMDEPRKALNNFKKAHRYSIRADVLAERLNSNENLAQAYRALGNADSTYYYLNQHAALRDSAFNADLRKDYAELQTKYESEQKEARIALLSEQNKVSDLKVRQKQSQLWMMGVGFVAIAIIALLLYFRFRERQRARLKTEIAREREAGLKAVIEATEAERARIARDLHDGVGQQLSGLKLSWQKVLVAWQNQGEKERIQTAKLTQVLDETATEVRSISHQMMPRSLSQYGLVPAVGDLLEKSLSTTGIEYTWEPMGLEKERFPPEVELNLYRVLQELINNILKHAKATKIEVQMMKNAGQLITIVSDNGVGMTDKISNDGIGLRNIRGRLNTIGGNVHFENNNGTAVTVRVKLNSDD